AKPYTALEAKGKKIYEREGCMYCHTQQVRNLLEETERYGMGEEETFKRFGIRALIQAPPSQPGEYVYDRPHLLGTRRVGPDLARVGGKYDNTWHLNHLRDPRSTSPGSLMPAYTWLFDKAGQPTDEAQALVAYLQKLGTNYRWREEGVEQARALQAKRAGTAAPAAGEVPPPIQGGAQ
ncbi:MAG TPA: cbb3-type cytochrome c oxidase subunit II, partial [Bacteroidota bacterium]|nr:cbb3-type cytochrome c oxidase subunit II [Bacteroidota bacterium]